MNNPPPRSSRLEALIEAYDASFGDTPPAYAKDIMNEARAEHEELKEKAWKYDELCK
jgi:hypothetical protein